MFKLILITLPVLVLRGYEGMQWEQVKQFRREYKGYMVGIKRLRVGNLRGSALGWETKLILTENDRAAAALGQNWFWG